MHLGPHGDLAMRTIVLILLTVLMTPAVTLAHLPHKDHPKIQDHKHAHKMKQAAKQCCQEQSGHHGLLHGLKHKHKH
jgi:hypothetical protein